MNYELRIMNYGSKLSSTYIYINTRYHPQTPSMPILVARKYKDLSLLSTKFMLRNSCFIIPVCELEVGVLGVARIYPPIFITILIGKTDLEPVIQLAEDKNLLVFLQGKDFRRRITRISFDRNTVVVGKIDIFGIRKCFAGLRFGTTNNGRRLLFEDVDKASSTQRADAGNEENYSG